MSSALIASLHLDSVLPAMALLAPHDAELRAAAAGRGPFGVFMRVRGLASRRRLAFSADGLIASGVSPERGDLRLWFPAPGQFVRTVEKRASLVVPVGGWGRLGQAGRFSRAGARLDTLLRNPSADPTLFAFGSLAVGLAGAAVWLRLHPEGAARRAALGNGVVTFACPALPEPLWIDLGALTSGVGAAPRAPIAELVFRDRDTLIAELEHRLDALAALGGGELRVRGHLLIAERLGLVLAEVGRLLNPPASSPRHE